MQFTEALTIPATFTDAEAAERLLTRLNRVIVSHLDDINMHSAERMMNIRARDFLQDIIDRDEAMKDLQRMGQEYDQAAEDETK